MFSRCCLPFLFLFQLLLLLLVLSVISGEELSVPSDKTWILYHAVGGASNWVKRGTVTLSLVTEEIGETTNDELTGGAANNNKIKDTQDLVKLTIENEEGCLSASTLESLLADPWYRLKLVEVGEEMTTESLSVMTTVSSCQVRRSGFRDEFLLMFGQQGHLVSFSYMPLVSPLAPKTCDDLPAAIDEDQVEFKSRISFETAVPGMKLSVVLPTYQPPPGLRFISKKNTISGSVTKEDSKGTAGSFGDIDEDGKKKRDDSEQYPSGPFGFLQRYWYIIVPLMIMNMMGSAPEDGQQQQQQQQQQEGGGAGTGPAGQKQPIAAAAGGGSSAPKTGGATKRRGKRG